MSVLSSLFGGGLSGPGQNAPTPAPMSPEESQYLSLQTQILQQQKDELSKQFQQQDLLQPYLLKSLGLQETKDANGNITGYEPTAAAKDSQTLQDLFTKRTTDALNGNLPVDPALERNISTQEQTLRESMRKNLGTGWETSTPGITALADFNKRAEELRYQSRTGQLTTGLQGVTGTGGLNLSTLGGVMSAGQSTLPAINTGVGLGSSITGTLGALQNNVNSQNALAGSNYSSRLQANSNIFSSSLKAIFGS